jgi:hypothetical protein
VPLLDVVQGVCDVVGLPRPSVVATAADQLGRQLFSLANVELRELSKRHAWPVLQREHTFATVDGTADYALPDDYRKLIGHTLYNASSYYELKGSVTPQEWQHTKSLNLGTMSRAKIRLYGSPVRLHIIPTPSSAEDVVFEYLTDKFAVSEDGLTPKARYELDTDVATVDEDLIGMGLKWRIKHAKGLDFTADLAEYEAVVSREYAGALSNPAIAIGGNALSGCPELTEGYVPENGFG